MAIDIGRINYQEYCDTLKEREGVSDLPKWETLGQPKQDAWRHAACAVLQYIEKERSLLKKEGLLLDNDD